MQYIKDRNFTEYIKDAIFILDYYNYNNIDEDVDYLKHFMKFEFLKTKAIKTIDNFGGVLYRGLYRGLNRSLNNGYIPDILEPKYEITSWTTDYYTAQAFASKNGLILIENDLSNVIFTMDHFMDFVKNDLYKYLPYDYQIIVEGYVSESEVICKSKPFKLINGSSYKVNENLEYLKSDAIGYNIGEYLYHITPEKNIKNIKKNGFIPKDGVNIKGEHFKNRLYFATSLIAAYDLSVNFNSYKDDEEYVIFKVKSDCINKYEKDPLFLHGIYVNYSINKDCIVDVINTSDLFNKFNDDDFDKLYENLEYKDMEMFYHQTDSDIEKIKKEGFNTSEVWAAPDDTASYGDNILLIYATVKKPFVMDKYIGKDYDIDINTIEKNIKYYNDIGGESNPKTFDTLRKLGYDAIIETNGDRCFLYPDRIRF